jgi:GDPmannose 4,6-dehydratase
MQPNRNIIFGITGQDGYYLTEHLLSKGEQVIGVVRRTSSPNTLRLTPFLAHPNLTLVEGDITDALRVNRIILDWEPEYVFNLAAQSHVGTSFREPAHTTDVVYKGCLNCLDAIAGMRPSRQPRFYQASSSEMYGASCSLNWTEFGVRHYKHVLELEEQFRESAFQNEETPMRPNSPYAIAKLAAHHAVRMYRESYGLYACSGILFNHESVLRPESFVTKKIAKYAARYVLGLEKYKLRLGNLSASRDWGHAADYVRAMKLMLDQREPDDYVVATGVTHTVEDFLFEAFRAAGCDFDLHENCPVVIDQDLFRPSEVPYLKGDAKKAKDKLGWKPANSFQELVADMVNWEKNNVKS